MVTRHDHVREIVELCNTVCMHLNPGELNDESSFSRGSIARRNVVVGDSGDVEILTTHIRGSCAMHNSCTCCNIFHVVTLRVSLVIVEKYEGNLDIGYFTGDLTTSCCAIQWVSSWLSPGLDIARKLFTAARS